MNLSPVNTRRTISMAPLWRAQDWSIVSFCLNPWIASISRHMQLSQYPWLSSLAMVCTALQGSLSKFNMKQIFQGCISASNPVDPTCVFCENCLAVQLKSVLCCVSDSKTNTISSLYFISLFTALWNCHLMIQQRSLITFVIYQLYKYPFRRPYRYGCSSDFFHNIFQPLFQWTCHFRSPLYLSCEPTALIASFMSSGSGPLLEWMWQSLKGFHYQCLNSVLISFLSFQSSLT